ncbi:MAG: CHAT domain-containing protein [Candidatus Zhuqueibacterota bacterium]
MFIVSACSIKAELKQPISTDEKTTAAPSQFFDLSQVYQQVTTHPEMDVFPAISPNGQWLAFASRRSGNMDIWVKSTTGGPAFQISTHRSDDVMPTWSSDGKKLVFVSFREDAAGDLWSVSLREKYRELVAKGSPKKLTTYLGTDVSPNFSPNGKYIAFTSDRGGANNIHVLHLKRKKIFQITRNGAIHPNWSPDGKRIVYVSFSENPERNGQVFFSELNFKSDEPVVVREVAVTTGASNDAFPAWSSDGKSVLVTRYDRDTNHDGAINPDDLPNLWKIIVDQSDGSQASLLNPAEIDTASLPLHDARVFREMQLLPSLHYDYQPVCSHDGKVYYISQRSGNEDIWAVPEDGPIPRQKEGFLQYQFASSYFPLPETDLIFVKNHATETREQLETRLIAFQRLNDFFPEEDIWVGWSLYEIARTYAALEMTTIAGTYLEEIIRQHQDNQELVGHAELKLYELKYKAGSGHLEPQVQALDGIAAKYHNAPAIAAKAEFFKGETYFLAGRESAALQAFKSLVEKYSDQTHFCAQAQILIGDIYAGFGEREEVASAYLHVVQNYPREAHWIDVALDKVLALQRVEDSFSKITGYRAILTQYKPYDRLLARTQLKIGEEFFHQQQFDAAIQELTLVEAQYPQQREEIARASLIIARVYRRMSEELMAISTYKKVIQDFGDVQSGLYVVQAKEELLELYLQSGDRYRMAGDMQAANSRYRGAIQIMPGSLDAHRGLVATMYSLGDIDEAVKNYEKVCLKNPDDETMRYILGLCYSYQATEASDRSGSLDDFKIGLMKKSNEAIEDALSKNYRLIPAYLTLSFNYEAIEKYERYQRMKPSGFFKSMATTTIAPIQSIYRMLTFQKEKTPQRWFEEAIDVLITAISLNDETVHPNLESELALNLASNYYNLQEFGFERAYYYYHVKMQYDASFANQRTEAEIYKRMGHCALVVEDFQKGPVYLKKAIDLYSALGDEQNKLLNIKRLALLYQLAGENKDSDDIAESVEYEKSVDYFKMAAALDEKARRYNMLEVGYRSIAYNYQVLNDEDESVRYAEKALDLIRQGKVTEVKAKPNWIKIGILGVEFPVWNLGQIGTGASTAAEGFTTDEEVALLYSIIGNAHLTKRSIDGALLYMEKKLHIYREREDRLAEAIILNNMGYLNYIDFRYDLAWQHFKKSLLLCNEEKNVPGALANIYNLGRLGVFISNFNALPTQWRQDTLQQDIVLRTSEYQSASLDYLRQGLELIEKEQLGYTQEKMQIYNILGTIHFINNSTAANGFADDEYERIQRQLEQLDGYSVADSCYRIALDLALQENSERFQITVRNNLGNLAFAVGDIDDSIGQFTVARELAIKQNWHSQLWKIDFILGRIFSVHGDASPVSTQHHDASFYFNEAIVSLERDTYQFRAANLSPFYLAQVRQLYEEVVDFEIANGNFISGLRLTEQFHGKQFLDVVSGHKLQLKKERHKIFLGNAKFLVEELASLDQRIKNAAKREEPSRQKLAQWIDTKRRYEQEYQELLKDLKEEDPELEAFIHVEPVTFRQVQECLGPKSLIVDYFMTDSGVHIWLVSADSVNHVRVEISRERLEQSISAFCASLESSVADTVAASEMSRVFIDPVKQRLAPYTNIIVVTDGLIRMIPFSYLINFTGDEASRLKTVSTAPSLANYYFGYGKRKIRGSNLLLVTDQPKAGQDFIGFNAVRLDASTPADDRKGRFVEALQQSDIIFFDAELDGRIVDPLMAQIAPRLPGKPFSFTLKDFYSMDLAASVVAINGHQESGQVSSLILERALMYAGAPSIVQSLWPGSDARFWNHFFEALQDYPPAKALVKAQETLKNEGAPTEVWAGYQVVGFEGMTDDQEQQFARDSFQLTVNDASDDFQKEKWGDAVKKFEQALIMAKKEGNPEAIADLQTIIIQSAARAGNYDKAIQFQLDLIGKAENEGAVQQLIEGYNNLFVFYTNSGNYERAIFFQNKFLELAKAYNQPTEIAGSYYKLGLVHERSGDFEKALEYFTNALTLYHQLDDSLNTAQCHKDLGRIYLLKLDNYSKAIEHQESALKILQQMHQTEAMIEILQNLGFSNERLANYKTSLKYQQDAFEIARQFGNKKWIALSQHYLSNLNWKMGNYQQAINFQQQANAIFQELNDVKLQVASLSTQGLILMSLAQLDEATAAEHQALELAKSINDEHDIATIHKNLGLIYRAREKWDLALQEFERATQIDEAINFKRGMSYDYRDLGSIYAQQGRFDLAQAYFRKGLVLSKEILDAQNQVQCYYEIARTHMLTGRMEAALDTLRLASTLAEQLFIPDVQWRAQRLLGQIYDRQSNLQESISAYTRALEIIEVMRSQIKVEDFKSGFIDDKLVVYHELITLYLKIDQPEKALEIVERAKSRNFIDMLANKDIHFSGAFNEQQFAQGKGLEDELRRVQNEIAGLLMKGATVTDPEKAKLSDLDQQQNELKRQYEAFISQLKTINPELAGMVQVEPLRADSLKAALPDSAMVIEYFYTEDQLFIFGMTQRRVVAHSRPIADKQIMAMVSEFRDAISSQRSVNAIAGGLYDWLILPLEGELTNINHIVIVPHGVLHYLPFAALMDKNQGYLIHNYALSLAPSSMVLQLCLEKGGRFVNADNWMPKIAAFGNPDLNNAQLDLPFAEKEVESVELLYPDVTAYLRGKATETQFIQSSRQSQVVLMSCHGEFDAANPLFSSLLLAPDQTNDGRLEAHEIFGLEMDSYLIAMSACETGMASISVGDEVIGLSRSFIYAGASSLLSSLWKVDDLATAVMVKRFFRYLKEGKSRAESLRLAMNFVSSTINAHPAYWAAFNLTGDFR